MLVAARALRNDLQHVMPNVHLSAQTVRNQHQEDGMSTRCPQIGVVLTTQHCAGRLPFAENTRIDKFGIGALFSQMTADSH